MARQEKKKIARDGNMIAVENSFTTRRRGSSVVLKNEYRNTSESNGVTHRNSYFLCSGSVAKLKLLTLLYPNTNFS